MKAKVIENGVYDAKGNRVPVGAEVGFKGDKLPAYLVGKAVLIEGKAEKVAVINPEQGDDSQAGGA